MFVQDFHNYNINEKKKKKKDRYIDVSKKDEDKDQGDEKKEESPKKQDDDSEATDDGVSYVSSLIEAVSTLNKMIVFLEPSDPDVAKNYVSKKKSLSQSVQATIRSQGDLLRSLDSMASDLESEIKTSKAWTEKAGDPDKEEERIESLKKKYEAGNVDNGEFLRIVNKRESQASSVQARNIFFERTKQAFTAYRQAVRAFCQCSNSILKDQKGQIPDWLPNANVAVKKILLAK